MRPAAADDEDAMNVNSIVIVAVSMIALIIFMGILDPSNDALFVGLAVWLHGVMIVAALRKQGC